MIGDRYTNAKTAVLDVCNRYLSFRGDAEDGVDAAFLKDRVKALTEGRFVLVVVGEVKAGKSTFINALLGERILPTDILQSSSAVVEIFNSDKKHVKICYADGHSETVHDDPSTPDLDEAFDRLRRIGAIKDKYRSIPTTLIDARIVEGSIKPGYPLPIDELEDASKLRLQDKEDLIQKYVNSRTHADIPEKITFGFPLKYAFDGFRLVDSPGVSARGGVQDTTYAYIQEANAVLFVHSLESPIESSSFYDFITQVVPDRARETLFLVLTKSGGKSEIEISEKIRETRQQYDKEFDQHRILHVDSMIKVVSDEIKDFDSAGALKKHYREQKKQFEAKYNRKQSQEWRGEAINFDIKLKLLNNVLDDIDDDSDHEAVRSALRNSSNFDEMERVIDEFSARAPWIQLSDLLDTVKHGYDNQITRHEQNLAALKKKRERPQTFENEISEIQSRLNEYQHSMNKFAEDVTSKFTGRNASYKRSLKKIEDDHLNHINSASTSNVVKKALADFHDNMRSFGNDVGTQIKSRFEDKLTRLKTEFKTKHNITVPSVDISGIEAKAEDRAYRKVKVPRSPKGFWERTQKILTLGRKKFWEEKEMYDSSRHLSEFKKLICTAVEDLARKFPGIVSSLIENFTTDFRSSLKPLIESRNKELEDIKTRRATNEEILADIASAEKKKKPSQFR